MKAYSYRCDRSVPDLPDDKAIIVFDGHCALCSGWVRFVLARDHAARYRLLAAQSSIGRALYLHYGLDPEDYQTNILIADGLAWFKSEGSIKMAEGLGLPWSGVAVFRILPLRLRDAIYDLIARNRLRLFGRRDVCYRPAAGYGSRFIE